MNEVPGFKGVAAEHMAEFDASRAKAEAALDNLDAALKGAEDAAEEAPAAPKLTNMDDTPGFKGEAAKHMAEIIKKQQDASAESRAQHQLHDTKIKGTRLGEAKVEGPVGMTDAAGEKPVVDQIDDAFDALIIDDAAPDSTPTTNA